MKFNFIGQIEEVIKGIEELQHQLGFCLSEDGEKIKIEKNYDGKLYLKKDMNGILISYENRVDFYRALAITVSYIKLGKTEFFKTEKREFSSNGAMLDVSRNAVLKVESIKKFIRYLALMGHNALYLYMEDTYQIENYEYFGYMRGVYSERELKQIDRYAELFGIEVIPCIQTLAHLSKTLRWRYSLSMQDTSDILLIDEEKTYEFIETMIKTMKKCFSTKKIHIGMDEAHNIGMGVYYKKHGPTDKFAIMKSHLERVNEIVKKYELEPMIWSDMFFRLGSETGEYYDLDAKMPDNISELIPKGMKMVYWDYYNEEEKVCEALINEHLKMKRDIVFAGGVWIWGSLAPNYKKTFSQTKAALKMCKKNGIKEIFATLWGDDGAETSVFESLLGLQLFAEYCFYHEPSEEHIAEMFKICTGCDMSAYLLLGLDGMLENNTIKKLDDMWNTIQTTKQVLYQDILQGLFDKNYEGEPLADIYERVCMELSNIDDQGEMEYLFVYHRQLVKTLMKKWNIGIRLYEAYHTKDIQVLKELSRTIKEICEDVRKTYELLSNIWLKDNKPFGLDVIDHRFGGLIARCERAGKRVEDYINGKIDIIEELEVKKLFYNNLIVNHEFPMVYEASYKLISTVQ